ncbi:MAG: proton-conducting transporter membrane subunit, partial [Gammaproteobacteria bacterium]
VITLLSAGGDGRDRDALADYRGLFWHRPGMAAAFTVMLLSLAGIPLTMGFIGKFYVVAAGIGASLWLPVVVLVVGSVIGLYYYLRIIAVMCAPPPDLMPALAPAAATPASFAGTLTLAGLALVLVWLGVYPTSLIRLLQATVAYLI